MSVYRSDFTNLGVACFQKATSYKDIAHYGIFSVSPITDISNGITTIQLPANSDIAYVVISGMGNGANMIVTKNEEIT